MRVVLVGASGTIGQAVAKELGDRHEIVTAGSRSGDVRLDITDTASIRTALAQIAPFDALVSATGKVKFGPLADMTEAEYAIGLRDKLMVRSTWSWSGVSSSPTVARSP